MLDPMSYLSRTRSAYRRLFMTKTGALKPEAEIFLNDLFEFSRFFKDVPADPQALAVVEGGRQVVRHILKRIKSDERDIRRNFMPL